MAMTEGPATGRSNESSRCRTRPRSWLAHDLPSARTRAPHSCDQPALFEFGTGFAAGDWRTKRSLKTMSPGRDRKSETNKREKGLQKRPFCLRAINFGFRKTAWWANQGSVDVPACFTSSKAVGAVFGLTPRRHQARCFRLGQRC